MAVGNYISRANMPTPIWDGQGRWDSGLDWDRPSVSIFWVSAPVIGAQIETVGVFLRNPEMWMTVYRWDGEGTTTFTQVADGYIKSSGAETKTWTWAHNCTGSHSARDDGNTHLYKFYVRWEGAGSSTLTLSLRAGSVKSTLNNNPDTYAPGNLIRACKPEIWNTGATYSSDADFVNGEKPSARRGNPIDWTNANFCYGEY